MHHKNGSISNITKWKKYLREWHQDVLHPHLKCETHTSPLKSYNMLHHVKWKHIYSSFFRSRRWWFSAQWNWGKAPQGFKDDNSSPSSRGYAGKLTAINIHRLVLFPNMVRSYPKNYTSVDTVNSLANSNNVPPEQNIVTWNIAEMWLNVFILYVGKKSDTLKLFVFFLYCFL